jgi:hypothetical protein
MRETPMLTSLANIALPLLHCEPCPRGGTGSRDGSGASGCDTTPEPIESAPRREARKALAPRTARRQRIEHT